MWEFAVGLIMLKLLPGSLALVSAYGLADGALQSALGLHIGAYIDRSVGYVIGSHWLKHDMLATPQHLATCFAPLETCSGLQSPALAGLPGCWQLSQCWACKMQRSFCQPLPACWPSMQ